MKRNRRAAVEDLWFKTVRDDDGNSKTVHSARYGKGSRWRARYVDDDGNEHSKQFAIKAKAQAWLDSQTAAIVQGKHVASRDAKITVEQWCEQWLDGYQRHRKNSVGSASTNVRMIIAEFGDQPLAALRPSQIKTWFAKLKKDGYAQSTISRLHGRLKQILEDAVHDGVLGANPCSRRTSPPAGKKKVYCCTTEQVWALHDAMPERLQVAILLGAFAGLRISEASGLRVQDVDFMRGIVHPKQQWRGAPLKNDASDAPIPIPQDLALMLASSVERFPSEMMITSAGTGRCNPDSLQFALAAAREKVDGLPEQFSFHDLRHYYASMLIASGADLLKVQARMRHAQASTTINVYGHLWPDADESTKDAVSAAITARNVAAR
jgi:integrase